MHSLVWSNSARNNNVVVMCCFRVPTTTTGEGSLRYTTMPNATVIMTGERVVDVPSLAPAAV